MTAVQLLGVVLGAVLVLVGLASAGRSLRNPTLVDGGGARFLVAVHDAAKAGFWITLGGAFVGLSLLTPAADYRWLVLVPIAMAALRLIAAMLLVRS